MDMRLVDTPSLRPFQCVDGTQTGPIVDTLITTQFGRVYLNGRIVREAAQCLGWATPEDHADLARKLADAQEKLADAQDRLLELEGEVAELQPVRDALDRASERWGDVAAEDEPVKKRGLLGRAAG